MRNTLEELWHGNISPETDSRTNTPEMKRLMEYMARHHDNLMTTMTDEQKDIFERFDDCWSEYAPPLAALPGRQSCCPWPCFQAGD